MKRFIMPLTAFLFTGTLLFSGCNGAEEEPMDETMEPAVTDTIKAPEDVDTLVVDTTGTGTEEVKVVDTDKSQTAGGKSTRVQKKQDNLNVDEDGNTATRRPQRNDATNDANTDTQQPTKTDDPSNTTTRRPQRP